jgi:hypothetical protein
MHGSAMKDQVNNSIRTTMGAFSLLVLKSHDDRRRWLLAVVVGRLNTVAVPVSFMYTHSRPVRPMSMRPISLT